MVFSKMSLQIIISVFFVVFKYNCYDWVMHDWSFDRDRSFYLTHWHTPFFYVSWDVPERKRIDNMIWYSLLHLQLKAFVYGQSNSPFCQNIKQDGPCCGHKLQVLSTPYKILASSWKLKFILNYRIGHGYK